MYGQIVIRDVPVAIGGLTSQGWENPARLAAMFVARRAWQTSWPHDPCGTLVDVDLARDFAEPLISRPLDCTSRGAVAVEGRPRKLTRGVQLRVDRSATFVVGNRSSCCAST